MAWKIKLSKQARRDLKNLSHENRKRIARFIDERLSILDDPRAIGKSLSGKRFKNIWAYRIGDYRLLVNIEDDVMTILVLQINHRREVYR